MAKLMQVLQDNPAAEAAAAAAAAAAAVPVIEFDNAAVRVGGRQLWGDINISIPAGQFVALLGPNGAGKTTLIKVALGLVPLSAGHVAILGRPPGRANHDVGYLPQRRSFDASLRVRGVDVVRLGLDGPRWGVPLPRRDGNAQRVAEVIDLVGASEYAQRPVGQVSGGEQQRLLIAQALVRNPRLLILDEPLDSLDLPNQAAVAGLISRICERRGVTVLMAAHDVNPILSYLDQVIYVAPGGAVAGPPEQVVTSATLSRLYRTPIEVLRASDGQLVVVGMPEAPCLHSDRHCQEERKAREAREARA
jgi:zinc/manganese transport system ATP-binding protein